MEIRSQKSEIRDWKTGIRRNGGEGEFSVHATYYHTGNAKSMGIQLVFEHRVAFIAGTYALLRKKQQSAPFKTRRAGHPPKTKTRFERRTKNLVLGCPPKSL